MFGNELSLGGRDKHIYIFSHKEYCSAVIDKTLLMYFR